jgi:hypothetical protein
MLLKMPKKSTIIELLTIIRKKCGDNYRVNKDFFVYRLKFSK